MSIYVYITRKPNPLEGAGTPVTRRDWEGIAVDSGVFRRADDVTSVDSDQPLEDAALIWTGHPRGFEISFLWQHDQVEVKGPDQPTLAFMSTIAGKLNARVVSETGEKFNADGSHASFEPYSEFYQPPKRSFFARILGGKNDA